jgi:hypothetical protein
MIIKRDERKREREREFSDPPARGEFLIILFVFLKRRETRDFSASLFFSFARK